MIIEYHEKFFTINEIYFEEGEEVGVIVKQKEKGVSIETTGIIVRKKIIIPKNYYTWDEVISKFLSCCISETESKIILTNEWFVKIDSSVYIRIEGVDEFIKKDGPWEGVKISDM